MGILWGLAIAFSISLFAADHAPTAPAPRLVEDHALPDALRCTPLEALLRKNGRALPKTDADWNALFAKVGGTGPDQYFSTSNAQVDLLNPRRIFTPKGNPKKDVTEESLYGRVFVAVGKNEEGNRVAEFITQDARTGHFLFGTIDPTKKNAVRIDALNDCRQCHKTLGPLYTIYPWTHSSANPGNQVALVKLLAEQKGEPYKSGFAEIEKVVADVRREIGADAVARLRKFGPVTLSNQRNEEQKLVVAVTKKVIDRLYGSPTLKKLEYQGVPIFRSPGYSGAENDVYSHDGSGAHDLHAATQHVHAANAIAQSFAFLPADERPDFIERLAKAGVLNAPLNLSYRTGPGTESSLTADPLVGPGKDTTIHSTDSFFTSLIVDTDSAIAPILKFHAKMAKTKVADAPKETGIDPRNPNHYDSRGTGIRLSYDEDEHSLLGMTRATRDYFSKVVQSRKGDPEKALEYALRAKWMKELYKKGFIPHPSQVKVAVMKGLGEYFSVEHKDDSVLSIPLTDYLSALEIECLKYLEQPLKPADSCVRCHGSDSYHTRYLSDFARWEKDLKSGESNAVALLAYLKKNVMPPANTPEDLAFRSSANQKALKEFLASH